MKSRSHPSPFALSLFAAAIALSSCNDNNINNDVSDGPKTSVVPATHQLGNAASGKNVFRFATFGNERFWTDAMRLQQGLMNTRTTPRQILELGVSIDADAIPAATRQKLAQELATDPSGNTSTVLNDPAMLTALTNANALIGLSPKDSNGNGVIDIAAGDKTGATCAMCHTATDRSVFSTTNGGAIGARLDGLAAHRLDVASLIALAENSRAYYPVLQLKLTANNNTSLGRAQSPGLTETSTEAEVDAFLRDKASYPVGMFDDTFDGNGDPMHNAPLFRQDLAFPYGSEGTLSRQDNFANLVYTGLLDPTTLTTTGGRAFLNKLGGAAGDEIANDYASVLAATGVPGPFPLLDVTRPTNPADSGTEDFPLGVRVDNAMLLDLNAYLFGLQAPAGVKTNPAAIARGRELFRSVSVGCTGCHNVDQGKIVPPFMVAMKTIFPGDNPVILAQRMPPLNPVQNTVASIFDDKMVVVNASIRGEIRGTAMPLLLDLARKPVFLHDNSVPSLDNLLDPVRGATVPHPFYLSDAAQRADVVTFLKSLDTASQ